MRIVGSVWLLLAACGGGSGGASTPTPDPACAGKHFLFTWSADPVDYYTGKACTMPPLPTAMTVSTDGTTAQTDVGECTGGGEGDECVFECPGGPPGTPLTLDFGTPDSGIVGSGASVANPGCAGASPSEPCCHEGVGVSF
jgi:hypothetical protein